MSFKQHTNLICQPVRRGLAIKRPDTLKIMQREVDNRKFRMKSDVEISVNETTENEINCVNVITNTPNDRNRTGHILKEINNNLSEDK